MVFCSDHFTFSRICRLVHVTYRSGIVNTMYTDLGKAVVENTASRAEKLCSTLPEAELLLAANLGCRLPCESTLGELHLISSQRSSLVTVQSTTKWPL
jgi:hypothetical protein